MKRGQVLGIIENCLDYPYSEGGDYYSNKILDALLSAGMLPPPIPTRHGFLGDENGMVYEWEE